MSQYYPQPGPFYPPEQSPEDDYYEEGEFEYEDDDAYYAGPGDSLVQRILIFCSGGVLVFICMSCCGLLGAGLWLLDPGSSLVATPDPASQVGLSIDEPAFPNESVTNEQMVKLTVLTVNRNAALQGIPPVENRELIVLTIELVNLGEDDIDFDERDFMLLNQNQEAYQSTPGAIEGALGRGTLPAGAGLEARLVFEVAANEFELILLWDGGPESEARYILLQ